MYLYRLLMVLAATMLFSNVVLAEQCAKTLMGEDCSKNQSGVSSHMRGNAVENARASKALQAAKRKAKKDAIAIGAVQKKKK